MKKLNGSFYFHFILFLDYNKMNFIASAISELISNLIPNDKQFYLTKGWVTEELIPTLKAMNQRG